MFFKVRKRTRANQKGDGKQYRYLVPYCGGGGGDGGGGGGVVFI